MNSLTLKIIAIVTMLADHVGYAFGGHLPDGVGFGLRLIGRLAFPIFCFLITEGYIHTKNVYKYALRLLTLAALSELPYDLLCGLGSRELKWADYSHQNVFFTLFLGLLAIWALDVNTKLHKPFNGWAAVVVCMAAASLLQADYSLYGVALIVLFYGLRGNRFKIASGVLALLAVRYCCDTLGVSWDNVWIGQPLLASGNTRWAMVNLFAAAALPLIFWYDGRKGYSHRWVQWGFYAFYPVHLAVLVAIYRVVIG